MICSQLSPKGTVQRPPLGSAAAVLNPAVLLNCIKHLPRGSPGHAINNASLITLLTRGVKEGGMNNLGRIEAVLQFFSSFLTGR